MKKKPVREFPRWWVVPLFIAVIVPWWVGVYEIVRWVI